MQYFELADVDKEKAGYAAAFPRSVKGTDILVELSEETDQDNPRLFIQQL